MMLLLTCWSQFSEISLSKRQMLSKIWCLASCGQFVYLYHLFCMKSNAIFHFKCSLYLLVSGTLIEFHFVWSITQFCCQVYRSRSNLVSTAIYRWTSEQQHMKTEMSKIMISYRLKYNRYQYFYSTGITCIPIPHTLLLHSKRKNRRG